MQLCKLITILLVTSLLSACSFALFHSEDQLNGNVIDIDTKEPVSDVLILAAWEKHETGWHSSRNTGVYKAIQEHTKTDGTFNLPSWFKFSPHAGYLEAPTVLIYKKGYKAFALKEYDHSLYTQTNFIQELGSPEYVEFNHIKYSSGVSPTIRIKKQDQDSHSYSKDAVFINKRIKEIFYFPRKKPSCSWEQIIDAIIVMHKDLPKDEKTNSFATKLVMGRKYWMNGASRDCKDPLIVFNKLNINAKN